MFLKILILNFFLQFVYSSWDNWWTYDGISGPDFWGLLNPKWSHCSKGKKQSPVDINTNRLLFDPGLKPIQFNGDLVEGNLENTGRGLRFNLHFNYSRKFIISDGPLIYEHRLSHLILHFGRENDRGSEHTINSIRFPGEIQLYFYNHILYENFSDAEYQPNGLAVVSILIQLNKKDFETISNLNVKNDESINTENTKSLNNQNFESSANENSVNENLANENINTDNSNNDYVKENSFQSFGNTNEELSKLLITLDQIKNKGTAEASHKLNVKKLMPQTQFFLTYQGSLTEPPCTETANWIILNRPIYIQEHNLFKLRNSIIIDGYGDNFRPIQNLNNRCITTNIINQIEEFKNESNKKIFLKQDDNYEKNDISSSLKKFCTTNSVFGYYTYKSNIKQANNLT